MLTKVSSKGQTVIPVAIREIAQVEAGDELEVGYSGGMIVMRKKRPLTTARIRSLLRAGRQLPPMRTEDEAAMVKAITRVRRRASR